MNTDQTLLCGKTRIERCVPDDSNVKSIWNKLHSIFIKLRKVVPLSSNLVSCGRMDSLMKNPSLMMLISHFLKINTFFMHDIELFVSRHWQTERKKNIPELNKSNWTIEQRIDRRMPWRNNDPFTNMYFMHFTTSHATYFCTGEINEISCPKRFPFFSFE